MTCIYFSVLLVACCKAAMLKLACEHNRKTDFWAKHTPVLHGWIRSRPMSQVFFFLSKMERSKSGKLLSRNASRLLY